MSSKDGEHIRRDPTTYRFPKGESFTELYARLKDCMSELVSAHRGKTIVVVTHGDLIKILIADLFGTGLEHFQNVNIEPASISVVDYFGFEPFLGVVNDTSHLDSLNKEKS